MCTSHLFRETSALIGTRTAKGRPTEMTASSLKPSQQLSSDQYKTREGGTRSCSAKLCCIVVSVRENSRLCPGDPFSRASTPLSITSAYRSHDCSVSRIGLTRERQPTPNPVHSSARPSTPSSSRPPWTGHLAHLDLIQAAIGAVVLALDERKQGNKSGPHRRRRSCWV